MDCRKIFQRILSGFFRRGGLARVVVSNALSSLIIRSSQRQFSGGLAHRKGVPEGTESRIFHTRSKLLSGVYEFRWKLAEILCHEWFGGKLNGD
jgi:hypothetical protein